MRAPPSRPLSSSAARSPLARAAHPRAAPLAALCALLAACSTGKPSARPAPPAPAAPRPQPAAAPLSLPRALATAGHALLVATDPPDFAALPPDQQQVALAAAQAAHAGDALAYTQDGRHTLDVVHLLRGLLAAPAAPQAVREYARLVWLNRGLHDTLTGHKLRPAFSAAALRDAALAAHLSGADLGFGPTPVELGLLSLEPTLFDPEVEARRPARGLDLTASASRLTEGVTLRDLQGFRERMPRTAQLAKENGALRELPWLLPAAAKLLEGALAHAAPPQRALLEPLALSLRTGEPDALAQALLAFHDANGPLQFLAGPLDVRADARGRKALFSAFVGVLDEERTAQLAAIALRVPALARALPYGKAIAAPAASALVLADAGGAPLEDAFSEGRKSVLFDESAASLAVRAATTRALADPAIADELARCAPLHRFAFRALRELLGHSLPVPQGVLDRMTLFDARADLAAWIAGAQLVPDGRCAQLWPQFAAHALYSFIAPLEEGDPIDADALRAQALEVWWLTAKGALAERSANGQRFLAAPDPARLRSAASELFGLLQQIDARNDSARLADLLERHASRPDAQWLREIHARLDASGLPREVREIPPRIAPGPRLLNIVDLDATLMQDWQSL